MARRNIAAVLIGTMAGFLIWAGHFLVIYVYQAVACARGFADVELAGLNLTRLVVVSATIIAGAGALAVMIPAARAARRRDRAEVDWFLPWLTAAIAGLALVGIVWGGLPGAIGPLCRPGDTLLLWP